jgi:hypothetical protein
MASYGPGSDVHRAESIRPSQEADRVPYSLPARLPRGIDMPGKLKGSLPYTTGVPRRGDQNSMTVPGVGIRGLRNSQTLSRITSGPACDEPWSRGDP